MSSTPSSSSTHVYVNGGAPIVPAASNSQSGDYTLTQNDSLVDTWIKMTSSSANNLTIPPNSMVPIENNVAILGIQMGSGTTTIVAGTGVTVNPQAGSTLVSNGQYAVWSMLKVDTNTWIVSGDLVPA